MQRHQVRGHQPQQDQRERDHVQREEAVQRGIRDVVVAADPDREGLADERDRAEQVDDHLRAPEGHLAPGKQVAEERLGHEREVDHHAEDPDQLARLAVRAVHEPARHVQVHADEEHRGAGGVDVADEPAAGHVAHDVLDRGEGFLRARLVVHGEEDARDDLDHQHQQGERAEVVPEVEVLRSVVLRHLVLPQRHQREARVDPGEDPVEAARRRSPAAC